MERARHCGLDFSSIFWRQTTIVQKQQQRSRVAPFDGIYDPWKKVWMLGDQISGKDQKPTPIIHHASASTKLWSNAMT
jgi:hypothetical protein